MTTEQIRQIRRENRYRNRYRRSENRRLFILRYRRRLFLLTAVVVVAAVVAWGRPDVLTVARWFGDRWGAVLLTVVATALLIVMVRFGGWTLLSWQSVGAAVALVAASGWLATSLLLAQTTTTPPDQRGAARVEAIKTGLGVAGGIGAVFALILAVRKQSHHETNSADTVSDATARRVTEAPAPDSRSRRANSLRARTMSVTPVMTLSSSGSGTRIDRQFCSSA